MELTDLQGLRGAYGYFKPGAFLSLDEVFDILESRGDHLNPAGDRMKFYLGRVKSDEFFKERITFPIKKLRHVTTEECMRRIMETESFIAGKLKMEPFKDFSYWSAEVGDVNVMLAPGIATAFKNELKNQFATSPAFNNSESRYGNFVFSFPLSDLLEAYKVQHCHGGEPQLRVLGTEMYKQEIAHIVMVHSPHIDQYNHLPLVPTLPSNSPTTLSVYRKVDRTLWWRPESTSEALLVKISSTGDITKECALETDCLWYMQSGSCTHNNHYSVWNHLIIAFHLPGDQRLVMPEEHLLQNLSTCKASEIYLRDLNTKLPKDDADEILKAMQPNYGGSPQ